MIRTFALALSVLAMTACATASKKTIADRLENLGLSRDRSECMASELDDRLNDDELGQFARFTTQLDQSESALEAMQALRQIDDPKIARAVTGAAFSCAIN